MTPDYLSLSDNVFYMLCKRKQGSVRYCWLALWGRMAYEILRHWVSLRSVRGTNQFFIANFTVNLELYITLIQLSTFIGCLEPKLE